MFVNRKVLAIDDDLNVHSLYSSVLSQGSYNQAQEFLLGEMDLLLKNMGIAGSPEHREEGPNNHNLEIVTVLNGMDGLQQVREALDIGNPFAAIVCDMRMPGWDGLKTTQAIRGVDPRCEILVASAHNDYKLMQLHEAIGFRVSLLLKPFQPIELEQALLRAVLAHNIGLARDRVAREFCRSVQSATSPALVLRNFCARLGAFQEVLYWGLASVSRPHRIEHLTDLDQELAFSEDNLSEFVSSGEAFLFEKPKGRRDVHSVYIDIPGLGVLLGTAERHFDPLEEAVLKETLVEMGSLLRAAHFLEQGFGDLNPNSYRLENIGNPGHI